MSRTVVTRAGSSPTGVVELNRQAQRRLGGPSRVEIVAGASHLFEEPGAIDTVVALALDWFTVHLTGGASSRDDPRARAGRAGREAGT